MKRLWMLLLVLIFAVPLAAQDEETIADQTARGTLESTDLFECEDVSPAGTYKCTLSELALFILNSAADLDSSGDINEDAVGATELQDNDAPGDEECLTYESDDGLLYWQTCGAGGGDSVSIDSVAVVDPDFVSTGDIDFTDTSNTITADINADAIDTTHLADADWGDFSVSSGSATLDADVVAAAEMADADHGDVSWSGGTATVDSGAVGVGELADDVTCAGDEYVKRNSGDSGWECATPGGAGDITDVWNCSSGDCAALTAGASDTLDLSASSSSKPFDHATDCSGVIAEGSSCWDTDDDTLYVGDGAAAQPWGGATGQWTDTGTILHPSETGDDVALGNSSLINSSKLSIDGDADQVQFTIQANGTQTDSVMIVESSAGAELFNVDGDGNVLAQGIEDIDGPGTNWEITSAGAATFESVSTGSSTAPAIDFDDSNDTGTVDASIDVNCEFTNDCDLSIKVDSGSDTETEVFKIDTTDAGDTTIQIGTPGTNYVNISEAGAMTFVGTGDIDLPDDSVDEADISVIDAPADGECLAYDSGSGDMEWVTCGTGGSSEWTDATTTLYPNETGDDVVLGGTSPVSGAKLSIDGDDNQIQLLVQGNGTQGADLVVFETSAGTDLWTLDNSGNMTVGGSGSLIQGDGAGDLDIDANGQNITLGDAAGNEVAITDAGVMSFAGTGDIDLPADSVDEADLKSVNAATDEYCLTYESSVGDFEWEECVAGGSGDNITVDTVAVVDPDFASSGDIDFVDTSNTITANLNADVVDADAMADDDHGDVSWSGGTATVDSGAVGVGELADDVTCAGDEYVKRNSGDSGWECGTPAGSGTITSVWTDATGDVSALTATTGDTFNASAADSSIPFYHAADCSGVTAEGSACWDTDDDTLYVGDSGTAQPVGGGSDTNAVAEFHFPAAALSGGMEPGDSFPSFVHEEGTNIDIDVLAFDDTTDECAGGQIQIPSDVQSGSTITFRAKWYSPTATTGNIIWDFRHLPRTEGEAWDAALTTETASADATQGTVDQLTVTTWTETLTNTGWSASDEIVWLLCRDANNASDSLVGDSYLLSFTVEVPRD